MPLLKRLMALLLVIAGSTCSLAQRAELPARKLVVATRHVPPFAIKGEDGDWSGIAIDLLREIIVEPANDAREAIELEFRELTTYDYPRLHVLPGTFERQDHAIAMPGNSPLREQVNRAVLRVISNPSWDETLADHRGQSE